MSDKIGIAVLGAGIFAREEHLPAIQATKSLEIKAIYSRSQASATALATLTSTEPDVYYESPASDSESLDTLLARKDISAVVICLPINSQPSVIRKVLAAGKHVLSEKPIAPDVKTAVELLTWYSGLGDGKPVWCVGENLRFVEAVVFGAEKVKEIGGDVVSFGFEMFTLVQDDNKFFNTEWRKIPEYQGGFLLDGGVHFVAALRLLLASRDDDIASLSAHTALLQQKLPPVDTVQSVMRSRSGATGTFCVSFGTEFKGGFKVELVTTNGRVTVSSSSVTTVRKDSGGKQHEDTKEFAPGAGVKEEMVAFEDGLVNGNWNPKQAASEALRDLDVVQSLLLSGEQGGIPIQIPTKESSAVL